MHIGLIGGVGPAATVAYYTRLVEEFNRAGLSLELTIVHADISVLVANAGNNQKQLQAEVFSKHIGQLKGAGCDIAMITALTGHFCFEETKKCSSLPLVNGTEIIDSYCEAQGIKKLGILGSPPVLQTRLFGLLKASKIVVPENDLEGLGRAYMEMAASGVCTEVNRQKFFDAGAKMVGNQHAEAILLAGTDLGLAFNEQTPGFRVIDALELHVEALVALVKK